MIRRAALVWVLASAACDGQDATKTVRNRSEAVGHSAGSRSGAAPTAAASAPRAPRALCTAKPAGKVPDGKLDTATAPAASAPPSPIPFGAGKWIWLNFWAAWCGPCKEEMPRLLRWHRELRKRGVLVDLAFVSLDDDERQLQRFLAAQPDDGVRSSYWLPEDRRFKFLVTLDIDHKARLPVHALVSPKGELACVIHGALDDGDYPRMAAVFGG